MPRVLQPIPEIFAAFHAGQTIQIKPLLTSSFPRRSTETKACVPAPGLRTYLARAHIVPQPLLQHCQEQKQAWNGQAV